MAVLMDLFRFSISYYDILKKLTVNCKKLYLKVYIGIFREKP
jgi:hypothetical protein